MKQPRSIPSLNENGEREREAVRDVYMEKRERDVYTHTQAAAGNFYMRCWTWCWTWCWDGGGALSFPRCIVSSDDLSFIMIKLFHIHRYFTFGIHTLVNDHSAVQLILLFGRIKVFTWGICMYCSVSAFFERENQLQQQLLSQEYQLALQVNYHNNKRMAVFPLWSLYRYKFTRRKFSCLVHNFSLYKNV